MQHILATKGQIDLLVNNAGHGFYSTLEDADMKDVHHQFNVNVFGVVRMTQAVLPSMRSQKSGMIINISSISGHISMPIFGFYAGTKHAVEALSDALRMEVRQFGIKTVIVEPGIFKTNFRETALHTIRKSHKTKAYDKLVNTEMKYLADLYDKAPDPAKVAKLIAKIAKTKHPKRRHVVGKGSKTFLFIKKVFGYKLIDFILRKKFGA